MSRKLLGSTGVVNMSNVAVHVRVVGESNRNRLIVEEVHMNRRHVIDRSAFVEAFPSEPLTERVQLAAATLKPFITRRASVLEDAITMASHMASDDGLLTQSDFTEINNTLNGADQLLFTDALIEHGIHVRTGAVDILTDPHENPDALSKRTDVVQGPGAEGEGQGVGVDAPDQPGSFPWTPADSGDGISNEEATTELDFPWPRKVEGTTKSNGLHDDSTDIESDVEHEAEMGWSGSELVDERWASQEKFASMQDIIKSPKHRPQTKQEEHAKDLTVECDLNSPSGRDRGLNPSIHEQIGQAYLDQNQWEDPDMHLGQAGICPQCGGNKLDATFPCRDCGFGGPRNAQQPYEQSIPLAEDESPFDKDDPLAENFHPHAGVDEFCICERCGKDIPYSDIDEYQQESNIPDAYPRICSDCAEEEEAEDRLVHKSSMREILAQGVDNRLSDPNVQTNVDEQQNDRAIPRPPEDEAVRYPKVSMRSLIK